MLNGYHPEMGEKQVEGTVIEASLGHYGKHWYCRTQLTLAGRGIQFLNQYTAENTTPQGAKYIGWNRYKVTEAAFEKLCAKYAVSHEMLL